MSESSLQKAAEQLSKAEEQTPLKISDEFPQNQDTTSIPYTSPHTAESYDSTGNLIPEKSTKDKEDTPLTKEKEESDEEQLDTENIEIPEEEIAFPEETSPPQEPPENGEFEYYDDKGKKYIITYENGQLTGPITIFDKNEQIEFEGTLKQEKLDGLCKSYTQGLLFQSIELQEDIPHGLSQQFDSEGNLIMEIYFDHGQKQGEMKQYHSNGELSTLTTFEKDKKEGRIETYTSSGQIQMKAFYQEDKLHGLMENFYTGTDGSAYSRQAPYECGYIHGKEITYYASGQIATESSYENGELKSPTKIYPPPKQK